MSDSTEWVRPLTKGEQFMYELNKEGVCFISYVMRVSTTRPLTEEDGRRVFTSLFRKTPNLRLGVGEKDGKPWLKQIQEELVDFKVLENADVFQTYHEIPEELFTFEGALWKARLLPWSPQQSSFVQTTSYPGEKATFEYLNHIVVYFSHVITDGYSCSRITRAILKLFNDLISGSPIDDGKQIGTLIDINREIQISQEIKKQLAEDPAFFEQRKKSYLGIVMETDFEKAFPVQPNIKPKTISLVHKVDKGLTKKFINRCKKEGLTVHTGFSALAEVTAIILMQEAGMDRDSFKISSIHAADNRVYYDNCHDELGFSVGMMDLTRNVKKDDLLDFWNLAKTYHGEFKNQHKLKTGFVNTIIEDSSGESAVSLLNKEGQASPSKKMIYCGSTNMRDITGILGDCGEHIELEFLDRLSTMHVLPCIWTNVFNTYKGCFWHSLQYNSHIMSSEVAKKYSDKLFDQFARVVEY